MLHIVVADSDWRFILGLCNFKDEFHKYVNLIQKSGTQARGIVKAL